MELLIKVPRILSNCFIECDCLLSLATREPPDPVFKAPNEIRNIATRTCFIRGVVLQGNQKHVLITVLVTDNRREI